MQATAERPKQGNPRPRFWSFPSLWITAILALAAFFRLFRLMSLFPILVDESIYIRWAEIIVHQGQWFISLLDAKQPLSYWIYALIRKLTPAADPLLGPRLVSVCAGLGSTYLLYRLVRRLSTERAGLIAALLYAVLPFAVLFDRLAYTDALVNFSAIALAYASVEYFSSEFPSWWGAILVGLITGVGYSFKSTFLLEVWTPILAAVFLGRFRAGSVARLAVVYASAAVLPIISFLNVPEAPNFEVNNLLVHHTSFFVPINLLREQPFLSLLNNGTLVIEYAGSYLTYPFALCAAIAFGVLLFRRRNEAYFFGLLFFSPLLVELFALWFIHSRYLFPLIWPLAVVLSIAIADLKGWLAAAFTVAIAGPMLIASSAILTHPERQLHPVDVAEFLSSGPFSGYGVSDAVAYVRKQSEDARPLTVLTDPSFGTPTDAIHAYLNLWNGIHVYDAWWLQLPDRPILPKEPLQVMKSQYERVPAAVIDFPALPRVYYITDTNYNRPADVRKREPTAKLEMRFAKRNGKDFVDVYRLR
jgi:4-amino-4-deoxy-L-arabinose transferase-like glycosyltransferase